MSDSITLNATGCLKTSTFWGYDTVYNVCNGTQTIVPWGGPDWILYTLTLMGAAAVVAVLLLYAVLFIYTVAKN